MVRGRQCFAHQDELVAAQARHQIALAGAGLQAQRHFGQYLVTEGMAMLVVDRLEAIEVDQQHRQWLAVAQGAAQRHVQMLLQGIAVGQAGQRVLHGQCLQALREHLNRHAYA